MKLLREIISWGKSLTFALVAAVILNVFVIQPTKVQGSSMQPTLQDNQTIFISKLTHTFSIAPEYNDIVIIDSRVNRDRTWKDDFLESPLVNLLRENKEHTIWVKRVIGKPGDVLEFRDGKVFRNAEELDEPYIKEPMMVGQPQKVIVPEGQVFVMGDNRNNSKDSRLIGCVPMDHVLGKKFY